MWVGVGNSGAIFTSSNGISWKKQSSTTSGLWRHSGTWFASGGLGIFESNDAIKYNSIMVVKYVKLLASKTVVGWGFVASLLLNTYLLQFLWLRKEVLCHHQALQVVFVVYQTYDLVPVVFLLFLIHP